MTILLIALVLNRFFHSLKSKESSLTPSIRKSDLKPGKNLFYFNTFSIFYPVHFNITCEIFLNKTSNTLPWGVGWLLVFVSAVVTRYLKTTCPSFFNIVTQLKTQFSNINFFYKSRRNNEHVSFPCLDSFREQISRLWAGTK